MTKITYVADIGDDIDDIIAIEHLNKTGRLGSVVLDGFSRDPEREKYIESLGVKIESEITTPIIFCGGAFTKIADYHKAGGQINLVVLNGFFAGANLVPEEHILDKFKGRITCRSYNPGLDFGAAEYVAANCPILAVSKNVCHHPDNVINKWHENYNCKPTKKLHDLLMVKEGLNYLDKAPMLCEYKEVRIFREGIQWGAEESSGSNVRICIYKNEQYYKTD